MPSGLRQQLDYMDNFKGTRGSLKQKEFLFSKLQGLHQKSNKKE
jgi:hypothetical protein